MSNRVNTSQGRRRSSGERRASPSQFLQVTTAAASKRRLPSDAPQCASRTKKRRHTAAISTDSPAMNRLPVDDDVAARRIPDRERQGHEDEVHDGLRARADAAKPASHRAPKTVAVVRRAVGDAGRCVGAFDRQRRITEASPDGISLRTRRLRRLAVHAIDQLAQIARVEGRLPVSVVERGRPRRYPRARRAVRRAAARARRTAACLRNRWRAAHEHRGPVSRSTGQNRRPSRIRRCL